MIAIILIWLAGTLLTFHLHIKYTPLFLPRFLSPSDCLDMATYFLIWPIYLIGFLLYAIYFNLPRGFKK
jgi:hypothetical protein